MIKGIFVTGTDTEVGKTFISYLIAKGFLDNGVDTAVIKPIATGGVRIDGRLISPDVLFLKKNLRLKESLRELNPFCLKLPLAPYTAAKSEKKKIDIAKIIGAIDMLKKRHRFLIVEGIGGVNVPITKNYFVRDLMRDVGFSAVIVSRPALGTINHTLLTINELVRNRIDILGIIINNSSDSKKGIAERTNPKVIEEMSGIPIICEIPYVRLANSSTARGIGQKLYRRIKNYNPI